MRFTALLGLATRKTVALLSLPLSLLLRRPSPAYAASALPIPAPGRQDLPASTAASSGSESGVGPGFRLLTMTTVASVFALIALGGAVRLTHSGLGCPDWPLCNGKLLPALETHTLIEYSHRMLASVVGLLVLATTLSVWRWHRGNPWLTTAATVGLVLLVVQVLLGGVTVLRELPGEMVFAHLAVAEALLAAMLVVCVASLRGYGSVPNESNPAPGPRPFPILILGVALLAYGLLLTGSYVTVSGATAACGTAWPLCQGELMPQGHLAIMHMVHRLVALVSGVLVVVVLARAWRLRAVQPILGRTAALVAGTFLAQVLVGASMLWLTFPMNTRLMHLGMGTVVWMGLAVLAIVALAEGVDRVRGDARA